MRTEEMTEDKAQWDSIDYGRDILLPAPLVARIRDEIREKRAAERIEEEQRQQEQENLVKAKQQSAKDDSLGQLEDAATVQANRTRGVPVFSAAAIETAKQFIEDHPGDDWKYALRVAKQMIRYNGMRPVISMEKGASAVLDLRDTFENLSEVIDRLAMDLTLAAAMPADDFRMNALLLLSEPGFGKTFFSQSLADMIGTVAYKISAAGSQAAFQLTGSSAHWRDASPGEIMKLLAGESASPILILDEVDKISSDSRFPVVPVLLDLFEHGTAKVFRDECLSVSMDASHMIPILTANYENRIPPELKSRIEIIEIPRPEAPQRLRIVKAEWKKLQAKTQRRILLDKSSAIELAERMDLDLRKTVRIVRGGFSEGLTNDSGKPVVLSIPRSTKRTFGFI